jgi:formyltetrahydrofolate deformylase
VSRFLDGQDCNITQSQQEVARIDHSMTADEVAATGRDLECQALAWAVRWHAESRVLLNGHRTIVFH